MRPRVIPADDEWWRRKDDEPFPASMRPRVIPADDPDRTFEGVLSAWGFNEAAGYPRG